jgi:hypothetical protein
VLATLLSRAGLIASTVVLGLVALAAPATASRTVPQTTACTGPADFGAQYLSSAWPGGFVGVPVYSNGKPAYSSNCYHHVTTSTGKSVESGMEWQCVELVNRLYLTEGWITSTWTGNGDQLYNNAKAVGLTSEQKQGSISYLAPGDVISFSYPSDPSLGGHAAVVSQVSGSAITLVNQNTAKKDVLSHATLAGSTLTMQGWVGYKPIGVIHAPSWGRAIEVPGTGALNKGGRAQISSVSCASAGNCSAGGSYSTSSNHSQAFVVTRSHGTWGTAIEVPGLAALNKGADAMVNSVSCASAGNCSAGGYYYAGSQYQAFVVSEASGTWHKAVEVPGSSTLNKYGWAAVTSLSCPSAGNCSAGGYYANQHGGPTSIDTRAFVVNEKNGTWGKATVIFGTAAFDKAHTQINTVSCTSAGNCSAGGGPSITPGRGDAQGQPFVVTEKNGTWGNAAQVPGAAALATEGTGEILSLDCGSAGNCSAGGYYYAKLSKDEFLQGALVLTEKNGTWGKATEVPGTGALNTGDYAQLSSVSCASAGNCSAGGLYQNAAGDQEAFVVAEVSGTWGKAVEAPGTAALNLGSDGYAAAGINSVSCPSARNCSAGGYFSDSSGDEQAFVATEANGTWRTAIEVPGLAALNVNGIAEINSVSCGVPGNCGAGGSYSDSSRHDQAFVVSQG